jgi:hypothetical protein
MEYYVTRSREVFSLSSGLRPPVVTDRVGRFTGVFEQIPRTMSEAPATIEE